MHLSALISVIGVVWATSVDLITSEDQINSRDGQTVVLYTSPYSRQCANFEPIWESAVASARHEAMPLGFAHVDCHATPELCENIAHNLPMLKVWTAGAGRPFRPSASSSAMLANFFRDVTGHKNKISAEEGEVDAEQMFSPVQERDGIPFPVYPTEFTPVHGKGESIKLTPDNFESVVVESGEPWMIKFYSPRCPYSRAMAPEWEKYGKSGLFNIAEFDCLQDINFCLSNGVQFYPTIMYVHSQYRREYVSTLEVPQFESFHQMQSGGQIVPTSDFEDFKTLVDAAASKGVSTFLYAHDDSTTHEDWDSLIDQQHLFDEAQSTLLRTDNDDARYWSGIHHKGAALLFAGKSVNENGEDDRFFIEYPHSNFPKMVRDPAKVREWVNQVRFASPIKLARTQIEAVNNYSDWHAVMIAHNTRHERFPELRKASKAAYDAAVAKQTQDRKELRDLRKSLHQKYKAQGKRSVYRKIYLTPVDAPFRPDLSFSYIPKGEWDEQFGDLLDTSSHEQGQVIFINFAEGLYLETDDFALDFDSASAKPLNRKMAAKLKRPVPEFTPSLELGDRAAIFGHRNWIITGVVASLVGLGLVRVGLQLRNKMRVPAKVD